MVNPWGCAWDRQVNEDNVDIFRNLVYGEEPAPPNPEYDEIDAFINPTEWAGPVKEKADADRDKYVAEHGLEKLLWAVRRGQHNHPKGLTFHGTEPTWSRITIENIVKRNLARARKIVGVDLHTGIGGYGETVVVSYNEEESERGRTLVDWYGDVYFLGEDTDPLLPKHKVMSLEALAPVLPNAEIYGFGVEWGGEPYGEDDYEVSRHMNYLQNYGDLSAEEAKASRCRYRSLFYGETNEWRKKAWENGLEFFRRTNVGACQWLSDGTIRD